MLFSKKLLIRRHRNIGLSTVFFAVAAFLILGLYAHTVAAEVGGCDLKEESAQLDALQKSEADYIEKSRGELQVKKQILTKVIGCGVKETEDLTEKIEEITYNEPNIQRLKQKILRELSSAKNYYQIQGGGISDLDLVGSRNLSKRILEWRQNDYNLLSKKVVGFLALSKNQELMNIAEKRIGQAERLIAAFKLYDNKDLVRLAFESSNYFKLAKENGLKAEQAFSGSFYQPDESIGLIKNSLESLAVVYKNLFDFNATFRGLLPKL
ncbi:MAG: hypothetical protein G01um101420_746 [Parcubacteria group bacterium Gr01-1014_20]|nr:MAG: hypothetical protein G01um101420_746 [Parcubacteria group bacterium Gr01-1014_20]